MSDNTLVELRVGEVAHGGHCVARVGDVVYFVRHALPGELVLAEETKQIQKGRVRFADAVEVLEPSAHRVQPPCAMASVCGGCDFQHVEVNFQLELKSKVLKDALTRFGKLSPADARSDVEVRAFEADSTGFGWRTRMDLHVGANGKAGLKKHSSNDVVPLVRCPIATPGLLDDGVFNRPWAPGSRLRVVAPSGSPREVLPEAAEVPEVVELVAGHRYRMAADGFWQAHRLAPERFVSTALELLQPQAGEHVLDLYAGVGLFTLPIADAVGPGGRVDAVEGDRIAAKYLARNSKSQPQVVAIHSDVARWLKGKSVRRADAALLDPPRSGAGRDTLAAVAQLQLERLLYVACDPVALGRDTAILAELGFDLVEVRAFDAFPMTHHLEAFALFVAK